MHSRSTLTNTTRTKRLFVHARTKKEKETSFKMFFRRSWCCCCKAKSFEQIIPLLSLLLSLTHELNSHASFKQKKKLFVSSTAALCCCQPITLELRICSTGISSNYFSFILLFYNRTKVSVENKILKLEM